MQRPSESSSAPLSVAIALREFRRDRRERVPVLRNSTNGQLLAVIDAKERRVYSKRPLEFLVDALAAGDSAFGELGPPSGERPHASSRMADESLDRLCWQYGARLAREFGLAPWINPDKPYRLLRWPDFGKIGREPLGALLCVILSQRQLDVAAMVKATHLPRQTVYGLVNSLSLCGSLASCPVKPTGSPRE